jgi:hypothetical protein
MPMVDGDWSVDRATGNIRYIGFDHSPTTTVAAGAFVTGDYYQIRSVGTTDFTLVGAADNNVGTRFEATGAGTGTGVATQSASYATVIQFHRWIAALADDPEFGNDDEHDIIDQEASARSTDNIIALQDYTATSGVRYNVDATAIEHLYDGTISQGSNTTEERWDGIVNFGNQDVHIQVWSDGAVLADDYWNAGWQAGTHTGGSGAATLTDSTQSWATDEWVDYWIKNTTDGSVALITGNTATTITGVLYGGTENDWDASDAYQIQKGINGDAGQGISHRFMVKVREDGVDIGRRRLLGQNRRYGKTYGEFPINGTSAGNNVLALSDSDDLNNTTAWATVDALVDITNTEGLRLIDISGDGADEEYYSEWDRGVNSINTFFEYLKHASADTTGETLQGESGELHRGPTHSAPYDTETGTPTTATNDKHVFGTFVNTGTVSAGPFVVGEAVHEDTTTPQWKGRVLGVDTVNTSLIVDIEEGTVSTTQSFTGQTSGASATTSATPTGEEIQNAAGEAKILAHDDDGATGNFYFQLTKGVAPLDNTRFYDATDHTDYYTLSADATERPVSTPFVGVSTGSALIGAYGLGLEAADTAAADTYFDLSNNPITPPNTVTMTASGFISGDYVLVTEKHASNLDINFTQMVSDTTLSGPTVTAVSVVSIPSDTPLTAGTKGSIRVERDDGLYSLHRYTAFSTSTNDFTIPSTDFSTNNATTPFNVFVGYLDYTASGTSDTFSYVYSAPRDHFMRVRDGGATPIKTAEAQGSMGTNGGTISVNRIDDT